MPDSVEADAIRARILKLVKERHPEEQELNSLCSEVQRKLDLRSIEVSPIDVAFQCGYLMDQGLVKIYQDLVDGVYWIADAFVEYERTGDHILIRDGSGAVVGEYDV